MQIPLSHGRRDGDGVLNGCLKTIADIIDILRIVPYRIDIVSPVAIRVVNILPDGTGQWRGAVWIRVNSLNQPVEIVVDVFRASGRSTNFHCRDAIAIVILIMRGGLV